LVKWFFNFTIQQPLTFPNYTSLVILSQTSHETTARSNP
jgi:hypothetical protein